MKHCCDETASSSATSADAEKQLSRAVQAMNVKEETDFKQDLILDRRAASLKWLCRSQLEHFG
jgi:hypothetical protein